MPKPPSHCEREIGFPVNAALPGLFGGWEIHLLGVISHRSGWRHCKLSLEADLLVPRSAAESRAYSFGARDRTARIVIVHRTITCYDSIT